MTKRLCVLLLMLFGTLPALCLAQEKAEAEKHYTGSLGAGLSPPFVGYMFDRGLALPSATLFISIGTIIGAAVLSFLKLRKTVE